MNAGDVAGGRDDPPLSPADDHRLVDEVGIVALLHRGIEGVAVDVRECQPVEFGMIDQTRAAALATALSALRLPFQAIAAKSRKMIVGGGHDENKG
jgi:hypothetical protein